MTTHRHADPLGINAQNAERLLGIGPTALGVFLFCVGEELIAPLLSPATANGITQSKKGSKCLARLVEFRIELMESRHSTDASIKLIPDVTNTKCRPVQ